MMKTDLRISAGFILILFFSLPLAAQPGSLLFNHLGTKDGLSDAINLYDVYKDQRGFIWISSNNGLNRFDGTSVIRYFPKPDDSCSIVGENIQSTLFEEDSTALWFSTLDAVNCYDWNQDCFTPYRIPPGEIKADGYQAFYLDNHHLLWILVSQSLDNAIYTFNTKTHEFSLVKGLTRKCRRALAVRNSSGSVQRIWTYEINGTGVETFEVNQESHSRSNQVLWGPTSPQPIRTRQIIAQGDSLLWVLTGDRLIKYNYLNGRTHFIPIDQGNALCLQVLNDSTLLVGFAQNGLYEFNIPTSTFTYQYLHHSENPLSLLSNQVDYISADRSGDVWVGTREVGLSYAHPVKKKFNTFYPRIDVPELKEFNPVKFLPQKDGTISCVTRSSGLIVIERNGPFRQNITRLSSFNPKSLLGAVYDGFQDTKGQYWLITLPGLEVFDPSSGKLVHVSPEDQIALSATPWKSGKMLFSGKGLFEVSGDIDHGFTLEWNPVASDTVQYMPVWLDSKGRLWLIQYGGSLSILDTADFHMLGSMIIPGISSHVAETKNGSTVWINSTKGLFEINSDSLYIRKSYSTDDGLPPGGFSSMIPDQDDRLWLTYSEGIIMLDPDHGIIRTYDQGDGLPSLQFTRAVHRFEDGEIWLGAIDGITRFYPDKIQAFPVLAIPQITDILANDHPLANTWSDQPPVIRNIPSIQKLKFNYQNNTLAFRVNALEYSSPVHNKVRYQMIGQDVQPIEITSGNLVRYPNLPSGTFRFMVYAANSDGVYNPIPRVLILTITPPYYKTWWFILLIILAGGSLLAYIVYLRFSKTLELQSVRLKLYENLHDDVGSRLTTIVLSAEEIIRDESQHHPKTELISKIAKGIVENMRRLVWAIDPENDKMNTLIQKINHDKSLILGNTISFHLEAAESIKPLIIPGEIRYQIMSICNEAFNNIIKYAKATEVTLQLAKENHQLHLIITDNGVGFDPGDSSRNAATGSGYGLNNMKRRATRVKGRLEIKSTPGEGTVIDAWFPLGNR